MIKIDKESFLKAIAYMTLAFLFIIYLIATLHGIREIYGHDKLKDTITMISQTATALSFIFIVYQYNINTSKSRDELIAKEAINVIDKMNDQIKNLNVGKEVKINEIKNFMGAMSNLGRDFHTYFTEIKNDALKAILKTHWQDMYFNALSVKCKDMKIHDLFNSVAEPYQSMVGPELQFQVITEKYNNNNEEHDEFTFCCNLLSQTRIGCEIKENLKNEAISFYENYCDLLKIDIYLCKKNLIEDMKNTFPIIFSIKELAKKT